FVIRRGVPESPRFLASHGRYGEVQTILRQITAESGVAPEFAFTAKPPGMIDAPRQATFGSLFAPGFARRTLVLWVMWATMNFSYYGIFLWLPTQFTRKGFSLQE